MVDHEEVVLRLGKVEESVKSAHKRLDKQDELIESIRSLASSVKSMQTQLTNVQNDMDAIKEKPAKRWEAVISAIITTIVGGVVGYLAAILFSIMSTGGAA